MVINDSVHLMFIEPTNISTKIIEDELTEMARKVISRSACTSVRYRGVHTCICGVHSDNQDYITPDGLTTNNLLVHYIKDNRDEVPEYEMQKLKSSYQYLVNREQK